MRRRLLEPALCFALVFAVYVAATPTTNQSYKHFVHIARAFLVGRVDLVDLPAHYHDVIVIGERTYAPFPPAPALLLLPAVAVAGAGTDQGRVGQGLAALAVAVLVSGLRRMGVPPAARWFAAAALAFGSVLWPATAIGTTWFFAQVVVVLSSAVLVWELAGPGRPLVVGAAIATAWLTRLNLLAATPLLAVLLWRRAGPRAGPRAVAVFGAVNAVALGVYLGYNVLRFGDPLQTGYGLLSMATVNAEAAARYGFFNAHFIPEHLYTMLFRAPEFIPTPPYLKPSPWGMALLFTSPMMVRLLFPTAGRAGWAPWAALAASLALPLLAYFSIGWVQFGYRYSLDWWVYVVVLLALAVGNRPRAVDYALLAAGVGMNALGVYWVRVLGW
ncbi:MAG: hypothetical protein QN174_12415 [Armatimonadota bacterium]|nr:hypothetical protein [Armatimonadota bacterium]MDR7454953.1 hypothetical protein [Armatimonadota bacterium]MDR7457584.1 hypothetical protein [Armatimonadota bacterium]MDR7497747.1 hypothetical protein [Armatimonadota bacterium]MDR7512065.1 hypothetical protein [Armatimonadota bacterium]